MKKVKNIARRGLLAFATRSYPKFGRQRRPFDAANPPQTVIDSPYYWWYQFLRLNKDYAATCKRGGRGQLSSLYRDFGDVFALDFKAWWTARDHLFAEPREGYRMMIAKSAEDLAPFDSEDVINLVVPLKGPRRSLAKSFRFLVLSKVKPAPKGVNVADSKAPYRLSGKWHIDALRTAYRVYTVRQQSRERGERLPTLIMRTNEEYEDMAVALSTRPEELAYLKQRLRGNRDNCPLFDSARFTRQIEEAYQQVMQRYWAGVEANHISVAVNWWPLKPSEVA